MAFHGSLGSQRSGRNGRGWSWVDVKVAWHQCLLLDALSICNCHLMMLMQNDMEINYMYVYRIHMSAG